MRRSLAALAPLGFCIVVLLPALLLVATIITQGYDVPLRADALRFARPWAGLLGLGALAVIVSRGYADPARAPRVRVSRGVDMAALPVSLKTRLRPILHGLRVTALVLCTLALMKPQSIHARNSTEVEGIDIMLTLDLSLSMQASDIAPNRFVATQTVVDEFISRRPNDRIGAVVFGRDAYTLMPLTTDKDMLRGAIADLELGMIEGRGTAIGNAVGVALNRLKHSKAKSKVMIVLTDGDSNSGNISPDEAAEFAKHVGVKLYTILMGRSENAPVQRGVDLFGRPLLSSGNFPVNPELLKRMSTRTGGEFFLASDRKGLERSFHSILDRLEKSEIEDVGAVFGELFAPFVAVAVLLLLLEAVLGTTVLRRFP
jgi:Ca-activated chloride channel family protein